jgi:hypothetical protein
MSHKKTTPERLAVFSDGVFAASDFLPVQRAVQL